MAAGAAVVDIGARVHRGSIAECRASCGDAPALPADLPGLAGLGAASAVVAIDQYADAGSLAGDLIRTA